MTPPPMTRARTTRSVDTRRRRLLFRATHRGTHENDLLVGGFVRAHLTALTDADLDALEAVLEMPDDELADWLTGRAADPGRGRTRPMLRRIRSALASPPAAGDERCRQGLGRAGGVGRASCWRAAAASSPAACCTSTRDDARMARLAEALAFFAPEAEILRFPAWDCLPYDRVSPNPALVSERIATLARLLEPADRPRIVLTTVNALVQRVPPRAAFAGASMELRSQRHRAAGEAGATSWRPTATAAPAR